MRVLLDECVHEGLRHLISGHEVETVRFAGLRGVLDPDLLAAAEGRFDVLVTTDRDLPLEHARMDLSISVVVLFAASNRLADLAPLMGALHTALQQIGESEVREVGPP